MKTKKIVWNQATTSPRTTYKFQEYIFTFDSQLRPVPVLVPEHIADILLDMEGRAHKCCHGRTVPPMFIEVE